MTNVDPMGTCYTGASGPLDWLVGPSKPMSLLPNTPAPLSDYGDDALSFGAPSVYGSYTDAMPKFGWDYDYIYDSHGTYIDLAGQHRDTLNRAVAQLEEPAAEAPQPSTVRHERFQHPKGIVEVADSMDSYYRTGADMIETTYWRSRNDVGMPRWVEVDLRTPQELFFADALEQVIYGEGTPRGNALGNMIEAGLGFGGVDAFLDVRDAQYTAREGEWGKTAFIGGMVVLPFAGALKPLKNMPLDRLLRLTDDAPDVLATRAARWMDVDAAPSRSLSSHVGGTGNVTRQSITEGLTGYTQQGNRVAQGIVSRDLGVNVLGDELFEKAYGLRGGTGSAPQAFAYGEQLYMRRGSSSLISDTLHEGTHGLDYLQGFSGSTYQLEKRAYFYERQFQRASGSPVDFPTVDEMLNHIYQNY